MKHFLVLLVAVNAGAANFTFDGKRVNVRELQKELTAAGIAHGGVNCIGVRGADRDIKCQVFGPSKDPTAVIVAHVYTDPSAPHQSIVDELAGIKENLDNADIVELRRAIRIILQLTGL